MDDRDPFAGITPLLPTRYAPGHEWPAYPYPIPAAVAATWLPVIYYPVGEVEPGEGEIWLVEPYPAARADGTDGLDPIQEAWGGAGVTVLRGAAGPRPRGDDPEGDWVIPARALAAECAYDVYVATDQQLMAAWCEAAAIAAALNNATTDRLGIQPDDIEVLLAAERGALTGDSRFAGRRGELRFKPVNTVDRVDPRWVPTRQARRLRTCTAGSHGRPNPAMLEPGTSTEQRPQLEGKFSSAGAPWTATTYALTGAGRSALDVIRHQYQGVRRCRTCGCTQDVGCPIGPAASCSWAAADLCTACA